MPGGFLSISGQIDFTCIANSDIELPPLLCQRCYQNQCAASKFLTSSFERSYLLINIYFGMVFREYKLLPYQQPWMEGPKSFYTKFTVFFENLTNWRLLPLLNWKAICVLMEPQRWPLYCEVKWIRIVKTSFDEAIFLYLNNLTQH